MSADETLNSSPLGPPPPLVRQTAMIQVPDKEDTPEHQHPLREYLCHRDMSLTDDIKELINTEREERGRFIQRGRDAGSDGVAFDEAVAFTKEDFLRTLDQRLTFGKYKNFSIRQVLRAEPGYMLWMCQRLLIREKGNRSWRCLDILLGALHGEGVSVNNKAIDEAVSSYNKKKRDRDTDSKWKNMYIANKRKKFVHGRC